MSLVFEPFTSVHQRKTHLTLNLSVSLQDRHTAASQSETALPSIVFSVNWFNRSAQAATNMQLCPAREDVSCSLFRQCPSSFICVLGCKEMSALLGSAFSSFHVSYCRYLSICLRYDFVTAACDQPISVCLGLGH